MWQVASHNNAKPRLESEPHPFSRTSWIDCPMKVITRALATSLFDDDDFEALECNTSTDCWWSSHARLVGSATGTFAIRESLSCPRRRMFIVRISDRKRNTRNNNRCTMASFLLHWQGLQPRRRWTHYWSILHAPIQPHISCPKDLPGDRKRYGWTSRARFGIFQPDFGSHWKVERIYPGQSNGRGQVQQCSIDMPE